MKVQKVSKKHDGLVSKVIELFREENLTFEEAHQFLDELNEGLNRMKNLKQI